MIWKSAFIMTIIDLIIIVITCILFLNYYQNRRLLRQLKIQKGAVIILSGLAMMAALYFADILTMHLFPIFMPVSQVLQIMTSLHLEYNWILSSIGFALLFVGIIYLNKIIFPKIISYQKRLELSSITDELTGLLNRRGLSSFAQKECEIANRNDMNLYLLLIDIDGLKEINDNYGHKEGDIAVKETSKILFETFRSSDVISRIGGDEFAVMAMEKAETTIEDLTERLNANLSNYNAKTVKPYRLSLSMGLIPYTSREACDFDEMLSQADELMYEQKRTNSMQFGMR